MNNGMLAMGKLKPDRMKAAKQRKQGRPSARS
jgi:hypothetical protein